MYPILIILILLKHIKVLFKYVYLQFVSLHICGDLWNSQTNMSVFSKPSPSFLTPYLHAASIVLHLSSWPYTELSVSDNKQAEDGGWNLWTVGTNMLQWSESVFIPKVTQPGGSTRGSLMFSMDVSAHITEVSCTLGNDTVWELFLWENGLKKIDCDFDPLKCRDKSQVSSGVTQAFCPLSSGCWLLSFLSHCISLCLLCL